MTKPPKKKPKRTGDDPKKLSLDRKLIALNQDYERAYWKKRFGVTLTRLRQAVKAVGPSARKVRAWLKENA